MPISFKDIAGKSKITASSLKNSQSNLSEVYLDKLFDGLRELAVTTDEELLNSRIENFDTELYPTGFKPYNDTWRYEPVDSKYFFKNFIQESLRPLQQECADIILGVDPFEFTNLKYEEGDFMWGKGSGKDSTVAKCFIYQGYKLACLVNPQKFLGLGKGSSIDIVNIASNVEQAKNIFFNYLKSYLKECRDPKTGRNWFATRNFWFDEGKRDFVYMDLRDQEGDIKIKEVYFGRGIQCHSLTSDKFTAEGKNLIIAIMDEVGAMKPDRVFGANLDVEDKNIIGQYKSLASSLRRTKFGKLLCISYKYGKSCPMSILVRKNRSNPRKFVRVYSVYDVRDDIDPVELRDRLQSDYDDNPELAKMMYECKDPEVETNRFYSNIYVIKNCVDTKSTHSVNPFRNKILTCNDLSVGLDVLLEQWFRGNNKYYYTAHADLAKGRIWEGDAAGVAIGHLEEMRVSYDGAWVEYYKRTYGVDLSKKIGELRIGVVIDLVLQLTCTREQRELRISSVRKFLIDLQNQRNFGFTKVTFDRWGSEESIQEFRAAGIDSELLSMDKSYDPWHTAKDFQQQGIWKTYPHKILEREMAELVDTGRKIDHPDKTITRMEEDGQDRGSKDLADSVTGVTYTLVKELYESGRIFYD